LIETIAITEPPVIAPAAKNAVIFGTCRYSDIGSPHLAVSLDANLSMTQLIDIEFEGERLKARPGESLASALTAHGIRCFRTTRLKAERGMFCGMGVCQECLVKVDGEANQRACMTTVMKPLSVGRETHLRAAHAVPSQNSGGHEVLRPDVLIVGAGPGGLAAAIAARQTGAKVVLTDERSGLGGQFFKQLSVETRGSAPPDRQHLQGRKLIETVCELGVELRSSVTIWGAFEPNTYAGNGRDGALSLVPKAAIIATGAYERGWPVPGWTLPGVMTTGAAQTLWRTARRLPGRRVLIAGNGPLNLQLAGELISGGAQIVAVAEAATQWGLRHTADLFRMLLSGPELVADGLSYHLRRLRGGARIMFGTVLLGVEQADGGLKARLGDTEGSGRQHEITADAVCVGYGFEPANELLRALGVAHEFDAVRGHLATLRNVNGQTSLPNVFAVGDCAGLGGARIALAEGTIAGAAAARAAGFALPAVLEAEVDKARAARVRHQRFQRALWSLFAAPDYSFRLATRETLICRCEEVTFGEIEAALSEGLSLIGAVKRRTRAGMGRCQGRYCGPILAQLLSERCKQPRNALSGFAPRIPVKPIAIRDLVRFSEP
jgi:NADPH-dependent 2,4-dienoyl-CoA reductase/sulfur reductase-like enzyme